MRKFIHLKFFSLIVVVVMLTVTINGVHARDHAGQTHETAVCDRAAHTEIPASQDGPCAPPGQHEEHDGCDTCVNCTCHAPLAMQPFQLSYNPVILDLYISAPLNFLPEVYLSLFVPPDSAAV